MTPGKFEHSRTVNFKMDSTTNVIADPVPFQNTVLVGVPQDHRVGKFTILQEQGEFVPDEARTPKSRHLICSDN
jgi:hypothetical protein